MRDTRQIEAERLAEQTFRARRERIVHDFDQERNRVVNRVTLTGNAAGYLPALIAWAIQRLQAVITARADAYVKSFDAFNVPCYPAAEKKILRAANHFAAASIMNVRADRSVRRHNLGGASPWHLEIEREMQSSAAEAVVRLKRQNATIRNRPTEVVVNQTFNAIGPNARNNVNSTDNSTNIIHQAPRFEELRSTIELGVESAIERSAILEKLASLESSEDRVTGIERYLAFLSVAANHLTLVTPFLPALSDWVHNLSLGLS